jgi:hypothetical protein
LKRGLSLILSARLGIQAFHRKAEWKRFQIMAILAIMAIPAIVAIRRAMFAADVFPIEDRRKRWGKNKGCDFGYAPAANSCEGANCVDACTVTALDAITAFTVLNPNCSSQSLSVFSGPSVQRITSPD